MTKKNKKVSKNKQTLKINGKRYSVSGPSESMLFRTKWLKKGFELIDITGHCKLRLSNHGWCSDFNEPDENIYHIQVIYRDDVVINIGVGKHVIIDEDKYCIFTDNSDGDNDFIIFRKVPILKRKKK